LRVLPYWEKGQTAFETAVDLARRENSSPVFIRSGNSVITLEYC